ncbi:unnamed protein product [Rhizophagus irregularis]|nr:unnamed protein product [Rhizophagus irregularis]
MGHINVVWGGRTMFRQDYNSIACAFDGNVVYNFETMEYILDYIFFKLGINTDKVYHPVLMTEPVCNPNHSRRLMSELLFESYDVPSLKYPTFPTKMTVNQAQL